MKSSSELFPVSLVRADVVVDEFIEDTYLLKPNSSNDKSVQFAVTRLGYYKPNTERTGQPVILVHGSFTNRGFWFSSKGKGLARYLLEHNLDPWMLEMRGHGDSPANTHYKLNNVEAYAEFDLPAAQAFVTEQTKQKPIWLGHSLGGVTIATSIAGGHLTVENNLGLILIGSQVSRFPIPLRIPFLRLAAKIILSVKKPIIKSSLGPEHEPMGIAKEFVRHAGWLSGWKSQSGIKYWHKLTKLSIPVLAFAGGRDPGDPAKHCKKLALSIDNEAKFYELSKKNGMAHDFGHIDMVIGKHAETEVWPKITKWIHSIQGNN
ncbi:MAG: pimeloyl-ACP methyl ester carboxylesterase [Crocinitomicaceae bacterium]|jgi:pimeloyl-ACP methyl ester carboxylesterase